MKAATFRVIHQGKVATIRFSAPCAQAYDEVLEGKDERSIQRRRSLHRYFSRFCDDEPHGLNDQQLKSQGGMPDGSGNRVTVWEFKAWQWRVYGTIITIGGRRCFVGLGVDPEKKTDKANSGILKAVGLAAGLLEEYRAKTNGKVENARGKSGRRKR